MMRRLIVVSLVIVAATAAALVWSRSPGPPGAGPISGPRMGSDLSPSAVVEGGLTHQFGTMDQESEGTRAWVVTNRGRADLVLRRGDSTCACTVADLADGDEAVVKPGDSTEVRLTWETRESLGKITQSAVILTNDPGRPGLRFGVEGQVEPTIVLNPPGPIHFRNVSSDGPQRRRIALSSPGRPGTTVRSLAWSRTDLLTVTARPLPEHRLKALRVGAGHEVDIELKSGTAPGLFHDEVVITTDHPSRPELRLPVWGRVIGPISLVPEQVRWAGVPGPEGGVATVMIRVLGRTSATFAVETAPGPLGVDIAPAGGPSKSAGRDYRMTVTVPAGTPPGRIAGRILLTTDHPRAPQVTVPVDVTVEEKIGAEKGSGLFSFPSK